MYALSNEAASHGAACAIAGATSAISASVAGGPHASMVGSSPEPPPHAGSGSAPDASTSRADFRRRIIGGHGTQDLGASPDAGRVQNRTTALIPSPREPLRSTASGRRGGGDG